mmetsp:Transcript_19722/g.41625  ORF Transcript_19722/g.41625 Transcript_19722/m.41625 type:complete len:84 (+) Transcript_19722:89-340(+)
MRSLGGWGWGLGQPKYNIFASNESWNRGWPVLASLARQNHTEGLLESNNLSLELVRATASLSWAPWSASFDIKNVLPPSSPPL